MKGLACALVLAGSSCALVAVPSNAHAARTKAPGGLQLSIITPDPRVVDDRANLDVVMRGGPVDMVELYLDHALVAKRQLDTALARGVISFGLDTSQLAEGPHDVLVKAYGGQTLLGSVAGKLRVPGADLTAPVRITFPTNGMQVSGLVSVRVSLDTDVQKQKPYVTFFVDKELKVLRNFPPYEYVWDTTKVPNGWHLLEAWTQTEDSLDPGKARPIHVNVNNSSGQTHLQRTVPDLNLDMPAQPAGKTGVDPSGAVSGSASVDPSFTESGTQTIRPHIRPQPESNAFAVVEPSKAGIASTSTPAQPTPAAPTSGQSVTLPVAPRPVPQSSLGGPVEPSRAGLPTLSAPTVSPVALNGVHPLMAQPAPSRMGGAISQPATRLAPSQRPTVSLPTLPRAASVGSKAAPQLAIRPVASKTIAVSPTAGTGSRSSRVALPGGVKAFQVAYDGNMIAFDVQPRVENGIGLTPFRQIFEHTGGRLYWFGGREQMVRAVNDTREIEMRIGQSTAKVNNKSVTLDRAPFVQRGRTMVPLKFIKDSMDVTVHFDPQSGRVLIESNK